MKWIILPPALSEDLNQFTDIPPLMAQCLYNRGIINPADADLFLTADERLNHDPSLLHDGAKAVARIMRAVHGKETIAVFGDFDADGITATAVLVQGLQKIGGKVIPYIPHRVDEGHGLSVPGLQKLHEQGVSLVITVDCGITGSAEVEKAQEMGLETIVTDHHEPIGEIPKAIAIIDPKLPESRYPFRELAGVGVAFKLLQALFNATGRAGQENGFLDLVAMGTVADLVPLVDENRYLVKEGLLKLNSTRRLGINAIIDCTRLELGHINTESISYTLAPRLNATGRLDHASVSYELLTTESPEEAKKLASNLETSNSERQRLSEQFTDFAEEILTPIGPDTPLLMASSPEFRAGINGLVAGRLVDKYYRPAVIVEMRDEGGTGSTRSIPEFNIVSALSECRDLLSHFGGHAQAAGFTAPNENIELLRHRLLEIARRDLAGIELQPTINIDSEVSLASLGGEIPRFIDRLEPFGQGNIPPTFLSRKVKVIDSYEVGMDGDHIKFKLNDKGMVWDAIGFRLNHLNKSHPPFIDVVYNLRSNNWGDRELLELEIIDFAPSEQG